VAIDRRADAYAVGMRLACLLQHEAQVAGSDTAGPSLRTPIVEEPGTSLGPLRTVARRFHGGGS
jgi:hypothetical protein